MSYVVRLGFLVFICASSALLSAMQPIESESKKKITLNCPVSDKCNDGKPFASRGAFLKHLFLVESICGECLVNCNYFYQFKTRRDLIIHCCVNKISINDHSILRYCQACFNSCCDDRLVYIAITPGELATHESNHCNNSMLKLNDNCKKRNASDFTKIPSDEMEIVLMILRLDFDSKMALSKNIKIFQQSQECLPYRCSQCFISFAFEFLAQKQKI